MNECDSNFRLAIYSVCMHIHIYIFRLWQHFVVTYYFFHSSSLRSFFFRPSFDICSHSFNFQYWPLYSVSLCIADDWIILKSKSGMMIIKSSICLMVFVQSFSPIINERMGQRDTSECVRAHAEWTKQTYITFIAIAAVAVYLLFFFVEFWSLYSLLFSSLRFFLQTSFHWVWESSFTQFFCYSIFGLPLVCVSSNHTYARTHTFLLVCCWCNSRSSVFMMRKTAQNEKRF